MRRPLTIASALFLLACARPDEPRKTTTTATDTDDPAPKKPSQRERRLAALAKLPQWTAKGCAGTCCTGHFGTSDKNIEFDGMTCRADYIVTCSTLTEIPGTPLPLPFDCQDSRLAPNAWKHFCCVP